jgi:hypothetical protein
LAATGFIIDCGSDGAGFLVGRPPISQSRWSLRHELWLLNFGKANTANLGLSPTERRVLASHLEDALSVLLA